MGIRSKLKFWSIRSSKNVNFQLYWSALSRSEQSLRWNGTEVSENGNLDWYIKL